MRLQVINYQGQRVLTTAQLAESYGTDRKIISQNFNRNRERYKEGKHYFALLGDEKREFLDHLQIEDGSSNANILYLWTEKGAWMHAKSLNTDQAWEAYEMLVDDYYRVKQALPAMSPAEILAGVANQLVEQERRMSALESSLDRTNEAVATLTSGITSVPDHTKVVQRVNEYARWTRMGHNEVYNKIYDILQARHGIDVRQRVENERRRINTEYFNRTGRQYSESTLKSKVNGIDIMVRMGVLDKFNEILVGMLAKAKSKKIL